MKKKTYSKQGFTLPEVLVTLAITAVLAAVLIPALNSNLFKGDTGRFAADLATIQTGIQQFVADVKRYPGAIDHLTRPITTSQSDINNGSAVAYSTGSTAKWKGPYISSDVVNSTAYGGTIQNTFTKTDVDPGSTIVNYITVSITGVDQADFNRVDSVVDVGTGIGSSTGNLRWATTSSTVTFLAVPIQ